MGMQRPIELSPTRWTCPQQVLGIVRIVSSDVASALPSPVELTPRQPGGFPRLRLLKGDAARLLINRIAQQLLKFGIDDFPIFRRPDSVRESVRKYITEYDLSKDDIEAVERTDSDSFFTDSTKATLLLLRGLLAGDILTFSMGQKRWRVNYGLVSNRSPPTKLVAPYRAKDNPTPRSQFSHPDVVTILTSLSYYYGGLEDQDLFAALDHLSLSDQAEIEYNAWMSDAPNMPLAQRQLQGINLKDRPQCRSEVFPHLRYSKSVIDYFLTHIVFAKEMKEFLSKLSASGWDIAKTKCHPTTGFSGTNDSRNLLPLDVEQLDIPKQRHTNALVLDYLLQPENSVVLMSRHCANSTSDARRLLELVEKLDPSTQVILDCGAQVLELTNQQVAKTWLAMQPGSQKEAVVFVNDEDEVCVLDRQGRIEMLQTSSYAKQLDKCLVFLDEAHTRGIDLRLPKHYRALVTLGANLTKDRLVQGTYSHTTHRVHFVNTFTACMRIRKLGKGQTVVFAVNEDIEMKILACTAKQSGDAVVLEDVIRWSISETFIETRRAMPLWAVQGERFLRQQDLWNEVCQDGTTRMTATQAVKFLEEEAQSLEQRYRPKINTLTAIPPFQGPTTGRVKEIENRCEEFEHLEFNSSTLQEEQERELSPEMEQERQVQRPHPAQPAQHQLDTDVKLFAFNGTIKSNSSTYFPAFQALSDTSAVKGFQVSQLVGDGRLLVTKDFVQTVQKSGNVSSVFDSYLRPVQWVLSGRSKDGLNVTHLIIISPWEAQQLLPEIRKSKRVALHLYKPRCNWGHRAMDRLDFMTIPAQTTALSIPDSLHIQLALFAGQLYFSSYDDYLGACAFLGLATDVPQGHEIIAADGFVLQDKDGDVTSGTSPVNFLQTLMSEIRRNGQGISKTHVGSMLEGKILSPSDCES